MLVKVSLILSYWLLRVRSLWISLLSLESSLATLLISQSYQCSLMISPVRQAVLRLQAFSLSFFLVCLVSLQCQYFRRYLVASYLCVFSQAASLSISSISFLFYEVRLQQSSYFWARASSRSSTLYFSFLSSSFTSSRKVSSSIRKLTLLPILDLVSTSLWSCLFSNSKSYTLLFIFERLSVASLRFSFEESQNPFVFASSFSSLQMFWSVSSVCQDMRITSSNWLILFVIAMFCYFSSFNSLFSPSLISLSDLNCENKPPAFCSSAADSFGGVASNIRFLKGFSAVLDLSRGVLLATLSAVLMRGDSDLSLSLPILESILPVALLSILSVSFSFTTFTLKLILAVLLCVFSKTLSFCSKCSSPLSSSRLIVTVPNLAILASGLSLALYRMCSTDFFLWNCWSCLLKMSLVTSETSQVKCRAPLDVEAGPTTGSLSFQVGLRVQERQKVPGYLFLLHLRSGTVRKKEYSENRCMVLLILLIVLLKLLGYSPKTQSTNLMLMRRKDPGCRRISEEETKGILRQKSWVSGRVLCGGWMLKLADRYTMNETRSKRYSYASSLPKAHHTPKAQSSQPQSTPKPNPFPDIEEELRKGYEVVQILKTELQLEKQGKQLLEEQNNYLNKKVQTLKASTDVVEAELEKYKEKYRKLKSRRKQTAEVEPFTETRTKSFTETRNKSNPRDGILQQHKQLREQLRMLQSRINTPVSDINTSNSERLAEENNHLRKTNIHLSNQLANLSVKLQESEIILEQLTREINIYHRANAKNQEGVALLESEIETLYRDNCHLKHIIAGTQEVHRREMASLKVAFEETPMRSTGLVSVTKNRYRQGSGEGNTSEMAAQRSWMSGSRSRHNSTKKFRYQ